MPYTVKEVSDLAGVSVRALHHYHHIGLLVPSGTSGAGYRLYADADLARLQQVLFFRELGFPLGRIKDILSDPKFDREEALRSHRKMLVEQRRRLVRLIRSVDQTIESIYKGAEMDSRKAFEPFDDSRLAEYREEARRRWGGTEAWKESEEKTARYSKADWKEIGDESAAINHGMAALIGGDPAGAEAQRLVGRWYRLINDRFYACTPEVFKNLGEIYVNDPRFKAHYDGVKPGLAVFMRDAMTVFADRSADL